MELNIGEILMSDAGIRYVIEEYIGGGGQGEVYRVVSDLDRSRSYALKWYFRDTATEVQKQSLRRIINVGSPSNNFLWPFSFVFSDRLPNRFGYVMNLREPRFISLATLMKGGTETTFYAICTAGYQLAESFLKIHAKGFFYCDISFGNVFFDPSNGDVAICDNDNVTIRGAHSDVLGTGGFMAPEIVRGDATPNIQTDIHSLAVLFFYLFMRSHPFEGRRYVQYCIAHKEDEMAEALYGVDPQYIFSSTNSLNSPDSDQNSYALKMKEIIPSLLSTMFEKAFTESAIDEDKRIRESQWRNVMLALRDSIYQCSCGGENFLDFSSLSADNAGAVCWNCGKEIKNIFYLEIDDKKVVLNNDGKLYPYHLSKGINYEFSTPIMQVKQKPDDETVIGLHNIQSVPWYFTMPGKDRQLCAVNKTVRVQEGMRIDFDNKINGVVKKYN